jgi:hypothetical protein
MSSLKPYTTSLGVGLGAIDETRILLEIWQPGMKSVDLYNAALNSGSMPNISARRLNNIIKELFFARYLTDGNYPAGILKQMLPLLTYREFTQLLFIYTCRVHAVMNDFITEEYWPRYMGGLNSINNDDAREFVLRAIEQGRTVNKWSPKTIQNVAGYVTGCCADFGLLESGKRRRRRILPFRLEPRAALFLAYDLHFAGLGDNAVISHRDWALFGMETSDVIEVLKQLSLRGYFIVQSAGDLTRISWKYKDWEELIHVISQG